MKWLVTYLLLLTGFVAVPCAGAQIVPPQTSDDPIGDAVGTATGAAGDLPVPAGGSSTGLDGTVSTIQQTATDALDSGASAPVTASSGSTGGTDSGGSRGSAHPRAGKGFRSRFDRLPPRLERLLERIELGRNVRANLSRLQQALASLSAQERRRVLRLLNAEIRRLRADGLSPAERRRIARLRRARDEITALGAPSTTSAVEVGDPATPTPARTTRPGPAGDVLGLTAFGRAAPPGKAAAPGGRGSSEHSGILDSAGFPLRILLAVGAVLLVILGGLAVREEWPA